MDFKKAATISSEWTPINEPIQVYDVCAVVSSKKEFICSYKIPHEQFEYLYFGSLDSNHILFAIQTEVNGQYYIRILNKKPEKVIALRLFKKVRRNGS